MAQIHGTSGAWQTITAKLENMQLNAAHPRQIEPLLRDCQQRYAEQLGRTQENLEDELVLLEQEITRLTESTRADLAKFSEQYALDIEQHEATLDFYKHDKSLFNFVSGSLRVRRETKKLARLRKKIADYQEEIEAPLKVLQASLEQKKTGKDELARAGTRELSAQVEFLQTLAGSQELAGAQAEIELLEALQSLPDTVHVLNNLDLKLDHGIRLGSTWLIHGHIDQLVITPAGLFAVEVRNWGKQLSEKTVPNPYEQIKNAAQLCYELVKADFPGLTVRSILAYRGHLPEARNPGSIKALPLHEVCAYITWFTEKNLDEPHMAQLVTGLQELAK